LISTPSINIQRFNVLKQVEGHLDTGNLFRKQSPGFAIFSTKIYSNSKLDL